MPELRGKADNKRISDMVDTYLKGDFKWENIGLLNTDSIAKSSIRL
jgi:hypothetical protein